MFTYFHVKLHSEIDQNSADIKEDMEKSKDSVLQRKIDLEEEKEQFQKAAFAVLDMLNGRHINWGSKVRQLSYNALKVSYWHACIYAYNTESKT